MYWMMSQYNFAVPKSDAQLSTRRNYPKSPCHNLAFALQYTDHHDSGHTLYLISHVKSSTVTKDTMSCTRTIDQAVW